MLECGGTDNDTIAGLEQVCRTVDPVFRHVKDLCVVIGSFRNRPRILQICLGV
jgi:hypothetical protein